MRWPKHPVQLVRTSRFYPPFCPWPECIAHRAPGRGFHRNGWYRKLSDPARIPRFICLDCERSCSRQTFSTDYYLKRPELLVTVVAGLVACSAHRQIARSAHCAKTTVTRMAERLGRHAILFHAQCRKEMTVPAEPIVHDHFETFVTRQDHALGVGTAVGARSWFVYDVDPAPHKRGGRRPDRSPDRLEKPKAPYVASIRRTFHGLISSISCPEPLTCIVDGRVDYRAAARSKELRTKILLSVFPNPKCGRKGTPRSPEAIARDHAMFPVDQLHQLLRHTCSDHKRETISFGRRLESILGRAHLIAVWKNFIKIRSERRSDRSTPAMYLGLADERWRWERVLSRRLFPDRSSASKFALKLYRKQWTPRLPQLERRHAA